MSPFVLIAHDGPDGPARRHQHRDAHLAYLADLDRAGRILLAGPIRNDQEDASVGAVIVFEAADLADAQRLVQQDPFVRGGVFASVTVAPFRKAFPKSS